MNAGSDLQEGTVEMPSVRVMGVTDNMVDIEDKTLEEGRFFSREEVTRNSAVVVIGMDVKEKFFEFTSPIGKTLKIRGVPVTIIGLERKRGSFFGQSQDRHLYIPITLHNQIFIAPTVFRSRQDDRKSDFSTRNRGGRALAAKPTPMLGRKKALSRSST